jgi:hypothetical protein
MRCSILVSNEAAPARLCWATKHALVAQTKRLHFLVADQALLLPLTQSLYVKGKVAETEKVIVNIGTDYYVEVSRQLGACTVQAICAMFALLPCQPAGHLIPVSSLPLKVDQPRVRVLLNMPPKQPGCVRVLFRFGRMDVPTQWHVLGLACRVCNDVMFRLFFAEMRVPVLPCR